MRLNRSQVEALEQDLAAACREVVAEFFADRSEFRDPPSPREEAALARLMAKGAGAVLEGWLAAQ